jgi:hypothetical protein
MRELPRRHLKADAQEVNNRGALFAFGNGEMKLQQKASVQSLF